MSTPMTFESFRSILPRICCKDTSYDPKGWTKNNPFWGHSDVVSLLAHSVSGGMIPGVSLKGTKFARLRVHFWNAFPDGNQVDFTRDQFGDEYPGELEIRWWEAIDLLANESTARRFQLLEIAFIIESGKHE